MKQSDEIFKDITDGLDMLTKTESYIIELGVLDDSEKVESKDGKKEPFNYAYLMAVHEYGAKGGIIPARPVLQMTIDDWKNGKEGTDLDDWLKEAMEGCLNGGWSEDDLGRELTGLCINIRNYASEGIRHGKFPLVPNAQSTIDKKGSSVPLLDTGALARHIVCRWRKNR